MMKDAFGAGQHGAFPSTGRSCPDVAAEEMKEVEEESQSFWSGEFSSLPIVEQHA